MIVIELIYNLSVLVALSVLSGFLSSRYSKNAIKGKILQGLLFGATAIIGMLYPFNFAEGIIFDGRSIVISLCALFFGPLSGSIAAIIAAGYRLSIGGGGAIMGVLVILSSFLIGYFFYNYRSKKTITKIQVWEFYMFGIIVHIFMLLFILTLPSKNIAETYKTIALTIIGVYPLVTVLIGRILLDQEQNLDFINTLKESEKLFRTTLYSIGDGVITTDSVGKIVNMNNVASEITGWKETEVKGKYLSDVFKIINEDTMLPVENPVETILREGYVVGLANHTLLIRKDGKQVPISDSGSPIKNDDDKIIGVVLVFRDQTEERIAEKKIIESESKYRLLIENQNDLVVKVNPDGLFTFVSPSYCKLFGKTEEELLGNSFVPLIHEDDRGTTEQAMRALSKEPFTCYIEQRAMTVKGWRWIAWSDTALLNSNGEVQSIIGVGRDITDRVKFEETLKTSEENYKYLFENNPQPMWVYDIDTLEYLAVNEYAVNKYGYTKEEFLSMSLLDIRPEDERERLKNAVHNNDEAILKSGYWKHRTKDGKILFVEIYSHRLDFMGRNARLVMANDVTERKQFEDALKNSEETYRLTAEQTGQVVYDHNMITKETRWTGAILNVTGYTEEEFIKDIAVDIYKCVHTEDLERTIKICKDSIHKAKNYRVEYRFKHKNGKYIYLEDNAAFIKEEDGRAVRMLGTLTNVNNRKLIENQLRNLSRAVEQSPVSIVVTDIAGNIEYVNPKFEDVSGYSFNEVNGKNPKILSSGIKSTDDYQEMWQTILKGEEWRGEFFNKKKNGELYWEAATISPILNEKNEIEKFIAVKEDITEQKKLTKELIEAKEKAEEMVRLKSYFFANMSHELRTPFVGILGFAEILKDVLENREEREYAEQILKSSKRLTDTLNKILNISRIEFDKVEVKNTQVDVCELLKSMESFYSNSAKLNNTTITTLVDADNLEIITDLRLLQDILNNLVSNAIKFTKNGSITLLANRVIDKDNARLLITVKDTGIGIPKEKQSLIWQEFRQASEGYNRSFEGTGLGLTITKRYVELLNGTIALISEEHKGTSFIISLPMTSANAEVLTGAKEIALIKKSKEKIKSNVKPKLLYVEDDAVALEFISIILRSAYAVDTAINSEIALEYVAKKEYDILMLDINLGRGMDGVELMQRIRDIDYYKKIPTVAITAFASDSDKNEFLSKGFTHYISKPFTQKELHILLTEIVNQI